MVIKKMQINIRFFGYFKKYNPSKKSSLTYSLKNSITIKELCEKINTDILNKSPGFLINGCMVAKDYLLKDGDKLSIITLLDGG